MLLLQSPAFIMLHRFGKFDLAGLLGGAGSQRRDVVGEARAPLGERLLHKPPLADHEGPGPSETIPGW
jgi:hypothetical protein